MAAYERRDRFGRVCFSGRIKTSCAKPASMLVGTATYSIPGPAADFLSLIHEAMAELNSNRNERPRRFLLR